MEGHCINHPGPISQYRVSRLRMSVRPKKTSCVIAPQPSVIESIYLPEVFKGFGTTTSISCTSFGQSKIPVTIKTSSGRCNILKKRRDVAARCERGPIGLRNFRAYHRPGNRER